jgi:hypothetical protein
VVNVDKLGHAIKILGAKLYVSEHNTTTFHSENRNELFSEESEATHRYGFSRPRINSLLA